MTVKRTEIGLWGEQVAAAYLERHGYTILCRRWRALRGDIDLIARDGDTVVFIEVKTRVREFRGDNFCGMAEDAVTPAKCRQLIKLATVFMASNPDYKQDYRIDVVAVEKITQEGVVQVRHFRSVIS